MLQPDPYTGLYEKSFGGTEQMYRILKENVDINLLNKVQIICSRPNKFDSSKKRVLWLHDMAEDMTNNHLFNKANWSNYAMFVFVSHSQRNDYIMKFNLPYSKCRVISNCVRPATRNISLDKFDNISDEIKLVYHTTPHRGLYLLYYAFDYLVTNNPLFKNATLDVFSSYEVYGWPDRDAQYKDLFTLLENHKNINYHGYKENHIVRETLEKSHIFAYPCDYKETGCCAAMEAMYHNNIIVTSDLGVLPETTGKFGFIYPYTEDSSKHAALFAGILASTVDVCVKYPQNVKGLVSRAREYCDFEYSVEKFTETWTGLLKDL